MIARHPCGTWIKALTVASFRTWRVSRPSIAQDPAINSNRNQHAPYLSKMAEREGLSACGGPGMVGIFNIVRLAFGSTHTPVEPSDSQLPSQLHLMKNGGERGIRTLGTRLMYTRFPVVPLRPLGHLSGNQPRGVCNKYNRTSRLRLNAHSGDLAHPWARPSGPPAAVPFCRPAKRSNPPIPNFPANCIL